MWPPAARLRGHPTLSGDLAHAAPAPRLPRPPNYREVLCAWASPWRGILAHRFVQHVCSDPCRTCAWTSDAQASPCPRGREQQHVCLDSRRPGKTLPTRPLQHVCLDTRSSDAQRSRCPRGPCRTLAWTSYVQAYALPRGFLFAWSLNAPAKFCPRSPCNTFAQTCDLP